MTYDSIHSQISLSRGDIMCVIFGASPAFLMKHLKHFDLVLLPLSKSSVWEGAPALPCASTTLCASLTYFNLSSTPVPIVKVDSKRSVTLKKVLFVDIPGDEVRRSRPWQMVESKTTTPHMYATASCKCAEASGMGKDNRR